MTNINLCTLPFLSVDYSNVLDFESETSRDNYFISKTKATIEGNIKYDSARTYIVGEVSDEVKAKLVYCGQQILEARKKYPNATLGDLYGEKMYLYPELMKAHQMNDKVVMEAYGFNWRKMTESDCVAKLMEMYQELVKEV